MLCVQGAVYFKDLPAYIHTYMFIYINDKIYKSSKYIDKIRRGEFLEKLYEICIPMRLTNVPFETFDTFSILIGPKVVCASV